MDPTILVNKYERHRRVKNVTMCILADYRAKNKKPSINEILQDVIQKDKEKRKVEKQKLMQLMKQDEREERQIDVEIMNPA